MRKENSTFNLNFLSEPGAQVLHNNDYYGCSELDKFACYVIADGMLSGNDKHEDLSARLAVEAVITAFNANPSIKRRHVAKYLEAAHKALRDNKGKIRRRASVTVVVTNYQKLRYGYAGNCRFNLYRSGKLIEESKDHSLSWMLMEEGQLPKDKIAYHAERNNLEMYCGTMRYFSPTVSKKIKLKDADIFSLFTRGVWENAHTNDMLVAIQSGENDPAEATRHLERLILDAVPVNGNTENYTVCFVFVDKVFIDPEAKKRRKKIIIISIIAFIIIVIIVVVIILYTNWRARMRNDMHTAFTNGIEYIHGHNFIRARDELQTAYGLAQRLRDNSKRINITNHRLLVDAVIFADGRFESRRYEQAVDAFGDAANRSRYANLLAMGYIESRRESASGHLDVHDYIFLGDISADIRDWGNAESKYMTARSIASRLNYTDGRNAANAALDALNRLRQQEHEQLMTQAHEQATAELTAAGFIIDGDNALRDGDLVSAALYYNIAREKFLEMGSDPIVALIDQKLEIVDDRAARNEQQLANAAGHVRTGDQLAEQGRYFDAKRYYLFARDIYARLGEDEMLRDVQSKIDLMDINIAEISVRVIR